MAGECEKRRGKQGMQAQVRVNHASPSVNVNK
jgi:hypothetical protein